MSFSTVGELIDALKNFDRSMPIIKSIDHTVEPSGSFYIDIDLMDRLTFRVRQNPFGGGYIDCSHNTSGSFDAVIL